MRRTLLRQASICRTTMRAATARRSASFLVQNPTVRAKLEGRIEAAELTSSLIRLSPRQPTPIPGAAEHSNAVKLSLNLGSVELGKQPAGNGTNPIDGAMVDFTPSRSPFRDTRQRHIHGFSFYRGVIPHLPGYSTYLIEPSRLPAAWKNRIAFVSDDPPQQLAQTGERRHLVLTPMEEMPAQTFQQLLVEGWQEMQVRELKPPSEGDGIWPQLLEAPTNDWQSYQVHKPLLLRSMGELIAASLDVLAEIRLPEFGPPLNLLDAPDTCSIVKPEADSPQLKVHKQILTAGYIYSKLTDDLKSWRANPALIEAMRTGEIEQYWVRSLRALNGLPSEQDRAMLARIMQVVTDIRTARALKSRVTPADLEQDEWTEEMELVQAHLDRTIRTLCTLGNATGALLPEIMGVKFEAW